jgi:ribosomal protein L40E
VVSEEETEEPPLDSSPEPEPTPESEPEPEIVEQKEVANKVCPSCNAPVALSAKFCAECGHKMGNEAVEVEAEKAPEPVEEKEAEPEPTPEPAKEEAKGDEEDFDYSDINPETDWQCFGQIEPDHVECKGCPYRKPCAVKSGVEL